MLTVNDLCYSETAEKLGIENKPRHYVVKQNLKMLCRLLNNVGIAKERIISAYRSPGLNKAIGGAPLSKHLEGCAVDVSCKDVSDCLFTLCAFQSEVVQLGSYISYFYMSRTRKKIHIDFTFVKFNF